MLDPGDASADALRGCDNPSEIVEVADTLPAVDTAHADAVGRAADAARLAILDREQPPIAPPCAAEAAFIASHAAAHAAEDIGAVAHERAWQAAWLAKRLALPTT
jgi:hypothetical protein